MEVKIELTKNAQKKLAALTPKILGALDGGIKDAAFILHGGVVKAMKKTPKLGREYTRTLTGLTHIASGPGNAPAIDTGNLVSKIRVNSKHLSAEVGTDVKYAKYLNEGTATMKARPLFKTALHKNRKKMSKAVSASIEQAIAL